MQRADDSKSYCTACGMRSVITTIASSLSMALDVAFLSYHQQTPSGTEVCQAIMQEPLNAMCSHQLPLRLLTTLFRFTGALQ